MSLDPSLSNSVRRRARPEAPAAIGEPSPGEAVAIIGLGYVGLPLAVALARGQEKQAGGRGSVLGFDINPRRIELLRQGRDHTGEVEADALRTASIRYSADAAELQNKDIYIVTVPTPVDANNKPDLGAVETACEIVGAALKASKPLPQGVPVVVFESTVYPGVTEEFCAPIIARISGREAGHGFLMGYSPERINPGDRTRTVDRIMKVVSGQTPAVARRLEQLYGQVTSGGIFIARDIRTAEAAKVIENAQRDINIAFINEVTMIFGRLGLSVYDVLEAARTKWNFLDFRPGLVGGHCIGVDPFYLAHCAEALGHHAEVILAGRRINDGMGDHIAERIVDSYAQGDPVDGAPRTLVLGLTFKENLPDLRNSKVVDLIQGLRSRGHRVEVHDSRADPAEAQSLYGETLRADLAVANGEVPFDCVVGAVSHDAYKALGAADLAKLVRKGGLVCDVKGMWRGRTLPDGLRRWEL
jgi:UDP-N-acetyl-D-glucosamine/UDP-N-acetyl-D-galactosamine dehydrogenase